MIRRGSRVKDKLRSQAGFSLAELLLAMLLVAMLTGLVGGGSTVVRTAWEKVVLRADAQTVLSMALHAVTAELEAADEVKVEGEGESKKITFYHVQRGYRVQLLNETSSGNNKSIYVVPVSTTEGVPILTEKAITKDLTLEMSDLQYDAGKEVFSCKISVKRGDQVLVEQELKVRPLNT